MAKYSLDLDEKYVNKVKQLSSKFGIQASGVRVEPIRMQKCKTYGEVMKSSSQVKLFTGKDDFIVVALYEEVFDQCDEQTQDILIENLLEQISITEDKEGNQKIQILKPQLNLGLNTYRTYGNIATQKLEVAQMVMDQLEEQEKAAKELAKANNGGKRGRKRKEE